MSNVFVSSVIGDFERYRTAAIQAVGSMGHKAIISEDFGARAYSSEIACTHEVEQSDIYLVILGERYGSATPEGLSVTQAEFRVAREVDKPILVFVQNIEMEPEQAAFKKEIEDYQEGFFRAGFSTTEELLTEIVKALRQLEVMQQAAAQDIFEARVQSALEPLNYDYNTDSQLIMAFWPQPILSIDIVSLESRLDEIFHRVCQAGIATLRDGYEPVTGDDWTGLTSGKFTYAQFDDGLVLLKLNPVMEGSDHFAGNFIQPSKLEAITSGFLTLCDTTSGYIHIELRNMSNIYVSDPPSGNSMSMRMVGQDTLHFDKLFLPLTPTSYNKWLVICLSRFGRTFGYK